MKWALLICLGALPLARAATERPNVGRTLFLSRCGRCHTLPQATRYTPQQWQRIVTKMAKRSGLKPDQRDAVIAYLASAKR